MLDIRVASGAEEREICYQQRHAVFVEEQGVPQDMERDEYDERGATHFLGFEDGRPVATARIVIKETTAKIGRVVVVREARGRGYGVSMMKAVMDHVDTGKLAADFLLDAQVDAVAFYERLGFTRKGDVFLDAGIPHVRMVREV